MRILLFLLLVTIIASPVIAKDYESYFNEAYIGYFKVENGKIFAGASSKVDKSDEDAEELNMNKITERLLKIFKLDEGIIVDSKAETESNAEFINNYGTAKRRIKETYISEFSSYFKAKFIFLSSRKVKSSDGTGWVVHTHAELMANDEAVGIDLYVIGEFLKLDKEIKDYISTDTRFKNPWGAMNDLNSYKKKLVNIRGKINSEFIMRVDDTSHKVNNEMIQLEPYIVADRGFNILIVNTTPVDNFAGYYMELLQQKNPIKINQLVVDKKLWRDKISDQSIITTKDSLFQIVSNLRSSFLLNNPAVKVDLGLDSNFDIVVYLGKLDANAILESEYSSNVQIIQAACSLLKKGTINSKKLRRLEKGAKVIVLADDSQSPFIEVRYGFVKGFVQRYCIDSNSIVLQENIKAYYSGSRAWKILGEDTIIVKIEEDESSIKVRTVSDNQEFIILKKDIKRNLY